VSVTMWDLRGRHTVPARAAVGVYAVD
jgi:hypothetical protein